MLFRSTGKMRLVIGQFDDIHAGEGKTIKRSQTGGISLDVYHVGILVRDQYQRGVRVTRHQFGTHLYEFFNECHMVPIRSALVNRDDL